MSTVAEPVTPVTTEPIVGPVAPHILTGGNGPATSLADLPALDGPRTLRPSDAGRRMSFEDFVRSDFEDGCLYELSRGIVIVSEIPGLPHGWTVDKIAELFIFYRAQHPGFVYYRAGGAECRLRLPSMKCDRHPDQAIYLLPPPDDGLRLWTRWVPDLVVEVVSEGGEERDYVEKREEYLKAGVREYWILNPATRVLHALQRAGDVWEEVTVTAETAYRCPLLPGLEVRPGDLFGPP